MSYTNIPVKNTIPNTVGGVTYLPADLTALVDGDWKVRNVGGGKVILIAYMPASSHFTFTVVSVADKFGRTKDLGPTSVATAGASPEIRVLGQYQGGLFNQNSGADIDYVRFHVTGTLGAIKIVALRV